MSGEEKAWSIIACAFLATVLLILLATLSYYRATTLAFIEHGYTRAAVPGETGAVWVKPQP